MSEQTRIDGYATAIFEIARVEGLLSEVEDELFRFGQVLDANEELRRTLGDPGLPPERRQAIVDDLLGPKATVITTQLVRMIVGLGRARLLNEIVHALVAKAAHVRKHELAEVRSAIPLTEEQRRRLADALSAATGKEIEVRAIVDPSVLGGVVAQVGDVVIDGSVRRRLTQLKDLR